MTTKSKVVGVLSFLLAAMPSAARAQDAQSLPDAEEHLGEAQDAICAAGANTLIASNCLAAQVVCPRLSDARAVSACFLGMCVGTAAWVDAGCPYPRPPIQWPYRNR
jgi:hypothetical protein